MSNIQTGAERMPHDLSHLGFLAGQIGRLITISTTPVIAGDSFEMDAVGALRLSPLRRGLAIDSTVDIFTSYVPHRHVYGEQWIKFMKDGVNATPLPTVNTTGYIDHAAFLGTINPDTNKIPKHTNLSKQQQVSEIMRQMLTQAQTAGQYFTNDQIKEMTRKVSAEVDLVHQQTQNQRYGSSHIG